MSRINPETKEREYKMYQSQNKIERNRYGKPSVAPIKFTVRKPGRNEPCPCDSKMKFKKCHGSAI